MTPLGPERAQPGVSRTVRPGAAPGDRVRRAGGPVRLALAVALVGAAPLVPGVAEGDLRTFGLAVAFGWIPAVGLVSHWSRRRPGPLVDIIAVALDLALVAMVQHVLEPRPLALLALLVVIVATTTYVAGRWVGTIAGCAGTITVLAGSGSRASTDIDPFAAVVFPIVLLITAFLLDAVATDRWQAAAGMTRIDEKSRAILTGIAEAVIVTSGAGRIAQWNRAATATFGCAPEDAKGRRCGEVLGLLHEVRELECSAGCALLAMATNGATSAVDVEVWRRSPTGSRQPLLASASPVLDPYGSVTDVVHSFRDITRLKQADEAKTLFLATASHELKTPLTVIRGFSQMLLLHGASLQHEEQESALKAIDVRAGQLTSIVDRLLMSSRIDAGRIDLGATTVAVAPILSERALAMEGATGRAILVEVDDPLTEAWCDPDAVTTVVDHLLDNAVKYTPFGGHIAVACRRIDDGVELLIEDHGVGMTEEQASRCFDKFWQAEATDVRRFGGTGIGLYIVRSLVEGMGGSISVTSVAGAGTTFRVVLRDAAPRVVDDDGATSPRGEPSMIREYMRQLGLPIGPTPAAIAPRQEQP